MIISYGHTTPAVKAMVKTVTRRDWASDHAAKFTNGKIVDAWSKSPRFGGHYLGIKQMIVSVTHESTVQMPDSDYIAEGLEYLDHALPDADEKRDKVNALAKQLGLKSIINKGSSSFQDLFEEWRNAAQRLYVVRFSYLAHTMVPEPKDLKQYMAVTAGLSEREIASLESVL